MKVQPGTGPTVNAKHCEVTEVDLPQTYVRNVKTGPQGPEGPEGPPGPDGTGVCTSPVNEDVTIGQPLYTASDSTVGLANAASNPRACFAGIAIGSASVGFAVNYKTTGAADLSTAVWDAVTGETGGLVPGASYFLDTTSGMLTRTPKDTPAAGFLVLVGHALSSTRLDIEGDGQIPL